MRIKRGSVLCAILFFSIILVPCARAEDPYAHHRELCDDWAPKYDGNSFLQWGTYKPGHNLIIKQLEEIPLDAKILDVACGTGILTLRLAKLVPEGAVVGVDFSPGMIAQALAKQVPEGFNVTFIEGNAEDLPFPDNSFDYVVNSFGFHFFPNPEKAVQEMHRVLKDGGRAFQIDIYRSIPMGFAINWFNRTFWQGDVHYYYPRQLRTFFKESGFEAIEQKRLFRRWHFYFPSLLTMGVANKKNEPVMPALSEY